MPGVEREDGERNKYDRSRVSGNDSSSLDGIGIHHLARNSRRRMTLRISAKDLLLQSVYVLAAFSKRGRESIDTDICHYRDGNFRFSTV